jgi:predicted phosphodiesterase
MCYQQRVAEPVVSDARDDVRSQPPDWLRRIVPWVATVLAGLFGAWVALHVAGTTHTGIGPLNVDAEIAPAWTGETVLQVDPLGTLVFDTHASPLRVTLSIRAIDVEAVQRIVAEPASLNALEGQLTRDLDDALTRAAVRAGFVAVIGALLAGGLVLRSWRRALLSGAVALGAVGLTYGLTFATFDRDAVQQPRYTGLLTLAPQVVGSAETITADFGAYVDQLAGLVTNVTRLYETAIALPTWSPTDDLTRVLLVSDLHLNPAAWGVIRAVADQYDVDVIVDAGDIADHGTAPEARYVEPISRLGRPYLFVKGNHDSVLIVRAVEAQPNAIVLDHQPVTIAGLRFLGAPDPRFTPDQQTRGTAAEDVRRATEDLAERARFLPTPPDVLVFHDPTHADLFADTAPLVLAGHGHRRQDIVLDDGTRIFMQGSTGGAGLRGLEGEDPTPVTLSVLYFDQETKALVAWDDIALGGLGLSTAEISRTQVAQDGDEVGGDEPDGDIEGDVDEDTDQDTDQDADEPGDVLPTPTP